MGFRNPFRRRKNPDQPTTIQCETIGKVCFVIDGRRYWWPERCCIETGALRWLAGVPQDYDVYWQAPGLGLDHLISEVDGVIPVSGDIFFTSPRLINKG